MSSYAFYSYTDASKNSSNFIGFELMKWQQKRNIISLIFFSEQHVKEILVLLKQLFILYSGETYDVIDDSIKEYVEMLIDVYPKENNLSGPNAEFL